MGCAPTAPPRPVFGRRRAAWVAVLTAGLLAPLGGCREEAGGGAEWDDDKAVSVELTRIVPEEVRDEVALTGQLEAEDTGIVRSELSGVIASIEFEEGQAVSAGDVLFRLADREWRARLKEAQAEQRLAQDVFDRTQRLTNQDVSSLARRIEAVAELDKAKARTALAQLQVDRTRVRAPFDGVVGIRQVAIGSRVEDDEPLVQILSIDRLQAIFTVQEQGVPLAKVGLPVHVRVVAYPTERFPGKVFYVAPGLDAASRRLILKAWIDNPDHRLKPGMFVNVDVEIARVEAARMVPETAIIYDRHGVFVWRQNEDGAAEKVPVELGIRQAGRVEITEGVGVGDVVVSAGIHKVSAGKPVRDPREPEDGAVHAREEAVDEVEGGAS